MQLASARKATLADLPAIEAVLARAFAQNVASDWMLRDDARRPEALRLYFGTLLRKLAWPHGEVWTTEGTPTAAALWIPPGQWHLGFFEQLPLAPSMVKAFGWARLRRSLACISAAQRHHPKTPHFYLQVLGVEPSLQGRGLGKAMMQPVLERCDAEQVPAFLETESEQNVRLYRSRGFEVTTTEPLPGGGPLIYYLWRAPRRL